MDELQKHSEIIVNHDEVNSSRTEKKNITGNSLGIGIVYLDRYPVRFYGMEVKIGSQSLYQVEDIENVDFNSYWVDWNNGFIYFLLSRVGSEATMKYFGTTYARISANRVYTKLDAMGNVVETIDEFIDNQIARVDKKIKEADEKVKELIAKVDSKIKEVDEKMKEYALAELNRITKEDAREANEGIRKSNEEIRKANEEIRKLNEILRCQNEDIRKSNEVIRESNETVRQNGYKAIDGRIDNLVLGQGSVTEVIDARYDGINQITYPLLKSRLDKEIKDYIMSNRKLRMGGMF